MVGVFLNTIVNYLSEFVIFRGLKSHTVDFGQYSLVCCWMIIKLCHHIQNLELRLVLVGSDSEPLSCIFTPHLKNSEKSPCGLLC